MRVLIAPGKQDPSSSCRAPLWGMSLLLACKTSRSSCFNRSFASCCFLDSLGLFSSNSLPQAVGWKCIRKDAPMGLCPNPVAISCALGMTGPDRGWLPATNLSSSLFGAPLFLVQTPFLCSPRHKARPRARRNDSGVKAMLCKWRSGLYNAVPSSNAPSRKPAERS